MPFVPNKAKQPSRTRGANLKPRRTSTSHCSSFCLTKMLGIEDYGSDSETEATSPSCSLPAKSVSSTVTKQPGRPSTAALPAPPSAPVASASSSHGHPKIIKVPKSKLAKAGSKTKKIALELPSFANDDGDDLESERPAAKRARRENGAETGGPSALLSMLPPPKKKAALDVPAPQRVLGGGRPGVVFSAATRSAQNDDMTPGANGDDAEAGEDDVQNTELGGSALDIASSSATSLVPPSLLLSKARGKMKAQASTNIVPEPSTSVKTTPAIDFFSLGRLFEWIDHTESDGHMFRDFSIVCRSSRDNIIHVNLASVTVCCPYHR